MTGGLYIDVSAERREGASEGFGGELGGFLAGGDKGVARRDPGEEGGDVGGLNHLQEGVGGIVLEAAHLAGGVVEGEALAGAEGADRRFVEAFLARHAEVVLVAEMDQAQDAPEVVDPVGVVERHAPAVRLRREAAQKQDTRAFRKKWLKRVLLSAHSKNRRSHGINITSFPRRYFSIRSRVRRVTKQVGVPSVQANHSAPTWTPVRSHRCSAEANDTRGMPRALQKSRVTKGLSWAVT